MSFNYFFIRVLNSHFVLYDKFERSFWFISSYDSFSRCLSFSDQLPVSTKYDLRSDPGVEKNYGKLLLEMVSVVPDGIVCFFVSYSYMDGIVNSWHETGLLKVIISSPFPKRNLIFYVIHLLSLFLLFYPLFPFSVILKFALHGSL